MAEWQRYTDRTAQERMARGLCPECGWSPDYHDGAGGPGGCTLTDTGVAGRIWQYQQDRGGE